MKEEQREPEFTPEYIDQLFSSTFPKPKPEKAPEPAQPAEKKAQIFTAAKTAAMQETETEEYEPAPPKSWRKPLLILAAAAVLILTLCLIIPNVIANAQSDRWQTRCEEVYLALVSQEAYHYKRKSLGGGYISETEVWIYEKNQLSISNWVSFDKIQIQIELWLGRHLYSKIITEENEHSTWNFMRNAVRVTDEYPDTLADGKYVLSTIRGSFNGTDVTFRHEKYGYKKLTFHFDASGTFVGLSTKSNLEEESSTTVYTFLPTAEEEILATIQKTYEEATQ